MTETNHAWVSLDLGPIDRRVKLFAGGQDGGEVIDRLTELVGEDGAANILQYIGTAVDTDQTAKAIKALTSAGVVSPGASRSSESSSDPNAPVCNHGPRTFKSGFKNGKKWSAWMCPTPQGAADKCAPEWA